MWVSGRLDGCEDGRMDYNVTMQEIARNLLEKLVTRHGRKTVSGWLGCTEQNLDYLRAGYRKIKGRQQRQNIGLDHLGKIALALGIPYSKMLEDLAITAAALETERRPSAERRAPSPRPER